MYILCATERSFWLYFGVNALRFIYTLTSALLLFGLPQLTYANSVGERANQLFKPEWHGFFTRCNGNCFAGLYGGSFLQTGLLQTVTGQVPINELNFNSDHFIGATFSKRFLTLAKHWHFELEVGAGQRFGIQDEQEFWVAPYLRYDGFFWNKYLYTSIGINTGLNFATGVSDVERARGRTLGGNNLLHFLSPEITFALPQRRDIQATVRLHHRSGAFGVISDTRGGAQYLTFGIRKSF